MEKLNGVLIYEFKYDSEDERNRHVKNMEEMGFECTGQIKKSDSLLHEIPSYYWYGKFIKYGINE